MSPKRKGKKKSVSLEPTAVPTHIPPKNLKLGSPEAPTTPTRIPHRNKADKLMMRFYEPLVLQYVLDPTRGDHIRFEPLKSSDDPELDLNINLRHAFIDFLAWICDFQKGGATVTAVALEKRPAGVVFWVAANESVGSEVISFLEGVLKGLTDVTSETSAVVEESTFRRAVEFGMKRVKAYWTLLQARLDRALKALENGQSQTPKGMVEWLSSFKDHQEKSMLDLCRFSYDARASSFMKALNQRSEQDRGQACMQESNATNFLNVRHYIGRLSSYMKAATILVATAKKFPALFDDFEVKHLPSPMVAGRPCLVDDLTTLDGIAVRMLPKDDPGLSSVQKDLQDMDHKYGIHARLIQEYSRPTFLPRVHAELIILEHFHTHQYDFVDRDRYIGCSKPACYCCYHYICAHPGNFVRPASHNKIYLNWRPPDIVDNDTEESTATHQRDIMNKMVVEIRKDVLAQIREQSGRRNAHPDSTTGITMTAL